MQTLDDPPHFKIWPYLISFSFLFLNIFPRCYIPIFDGLVLLTKSFLFWYTASKKGKKCLTAPAAKTVSIKPFDNFFYWNTLVPIFSLYLSILIKAFDNILQWNQSNPLQKSSTETPFNPFSHQVYPSDVRDLDLWVPKGKSIFQNHIVDLQKYVIPEQCLIWLNHNDR